MPYEEWFRAHGNLAGSRAAGFRSCEGIVVIAYSCVNGVPRRWVYGPLKPRAHARGYSCTASSRLVWNSSENTWPYRMGTKPGAKRRKLVPRA